MLWLCLHFPLLPLQVFTRSGDDQAKQAVLISEKNRVFCANSLALQQGVRPGQSTTTASALNHELHIMIRNIDQEVRALDRLANWCYQFSPMVSLKPPNTILLEIQGSLRLFNGLTALTEQINEGLSNMGFSPKFGLGNTPKAAELFARNKQQEIITNTESSNYQQALEQTPLAYLDIPDQQITQLQDMGLTRLGELLALPQQALGKRFGIAFLHYLQQIMGERLDPQLPISLKPNFQSELFYIEGIEDKQGLLFPVKRLLSELCEFLRAHQLHCQTFTWDFTELNGKPTHLTLELSQAQNNLATLLELTRIKIDNLVLPENIHSIKLSAKNFIAARPTSGSLLELTQNSRHSQHSQHSQHIAPELLLDKLSARLGKDALQGLTLCTEHVPEMASKALPYEHLVASNKPPEATQQLRPYWLLPEPSPIQQRQKKLYWQGALTLIRGPERIDSHWWHKPHIKRDYFIARHENGGLFWVFRRLTDRQWFLHGLFY